MYSNEYKKWYLVIAIFALISLFFGGSLAYFQWTTNTEQRTNIVLTVTTTFMCEADGGGNISSEEKYLVPTDCTNSDYAIKREIKVTPTIYGEYSITMDLWLDVKSISTGLKNSNNFKYALTIDPNSCTNEVVKSGTFKGKNTNDKAPLFNYMGYNTTTTDTYYLYIWLDKAETDASTMDQEFSLSLNGICTDAPPPDTYVVYTEEDTTLRFYNNSDTSQVSNNINNYNVTTLDNNNIEKIEDLIIDEKDKKYIDLENVTYTNANQLPWYDYRESITRVIFEDEITPVSMNNWFSGMTNVEYMDVSKIDTSKITNMGDLFYGIGSNVTDSFEIVGLNYWNTSNVTNMYRMFNNAGKNATTFELNLSGWDVSNVKNARDLFRLAGANATSWDIGDLNNWDVSSVTNMDGMFSNSGANSQNWNIGDLSNWDVSNVTNMQDMFAHTGKNSTIWDIGDISSWNTSNVTNMSYMFTSAGYNATTWNIGDISGWNVSNVINMVGMYQNAGRSATYSLDLSGWDVSKVTNYGSFGDTNKIIPPVWNTSS